MLAGASLTTCWISDARGCVGHGIAGMGEALLAVGWLHDIGDGIVFPNWKRFNRRSAKQRLLAAERKRRQRDGDSGE